MKQTPISARINTDVLKFIKECHQPVNSLINSLLEEWMKKRQDKELILFQEVTGTDELNQLAERHTERNNQCCFNCKYNERHHIIDCIKTSIIRTDISSHKFCCIYWEKKKERK